MDVAAILNALDKLWHRLPDLAGTSWPDLQQELTPMVDRVKESKSELQRQTAAGAILMVIAKYPQVKAEFHLQEKAEYFRDVQFRRDSLQVGDVSIACYNVREALLWLSENHPVPFGILREHLSERGLQFDSELVRAVTQFQTIEVNQLTDGKVGVNTSRRLAEALVARDYDWRDRLDDPLAKPYYFFLSYARKDGQKAADDIRDGLLDSYVPVFKDIEPTFPIWFRAANQRGSMRSREVRCGAVRLDAGQYSVWFLVKPLFRTPVASQFVLRIALPVRF